MRASLVYRYLTATWYALSEQARNRTALLLLVIFVPTWDYLFWLVVPDAPLSFLFRATNQFIQVNGRELTLLTAGLNSITLIVGFMLFASTRRNTQFDRRLVQCGYQQSLLILAKLTALVAIAFVVSCYTSVVLWVFWRPFSLPFVLLGLFCAALSYGALGVLLGVLVRGELEGFFLIIMVSLIDTSLQNPLGNPVANQDFLRWFPSFAPMQLAVAGAFTQQHSLALPALIVSVADWLCAARHGHLLVEDTRLERPYSASLRRIEGRCCGGYREQKCVA